MKQKSPELTYFQIFDEDLPSELFGVWFGNWLRINRYCDGDFAEMLNIQDHQVTQARIGFCFPCDEICQFFGIERYKDIKYEQETVIKAVDCFKYRKRANNESD